HYRTANGAKIDFVARIGHMVFALECKASFAPVLTKGNYLALGDIAPTHTFVVTPNDHGWPMSAEIDVVSLSELKVQLESRTGSAA
ncbi:MAG: DUF4143 domain-containing protein, partial [Clostridiales bacterium]|nr:DUF4143 domain-containing protein [Clostridiales bacterium]